MATVTINNSPVHSDSIITYPYRIADSGYTCGWHTGVDFAPYGSTENNPILYPVKKGDCLCNIAKKFNTTVEKIAKDNNITNVDLIYVGQKLIIRR